MESLFTYDSYVTGKQFIARQSEVETTIEKLKNGEHILLYEPPKSGKKSLILHSLAKSGLKNSKKLFQINLFNVRSAEQLETKYRNLFATVIEAGAANSEPKAGATNSEPKAGAASGELTDQMWWQIFALPQRWAEQNEKEVILYFEEFQELLTLDNSREILKIMEKALPTHSSVTYIITGSMVNSMKWIFEEYNYFYNLATRVKLAPLDQQTIYQYYRRAFFTTGRVVSPELAFLMHKLVEGHPWYVQQLGELAYGQTRGFLTKKVVEDSYQKLIEIHSYRFQIITSRLTRFQISFLKATIDGVVQFSSADAIETYNFNSSANVKRLKDAMKRKELLTEEGDHFIFLDPLFKAWLQQVYFKM